MAPSRTICFETLDDKRDRYRSAIEDYRDGQLSETLALLAREGSPLGNVRSVLRFFEQRTSHPSCRDCLLPNAIVEMGDDPEIAGRVQEILGLLEDALERALRAAQARGELTASKDPHELSHALTNALIGLSVTTRLPFGQTAIRGICFGTLSLLH